MRIKNYLTPDTYFRTMADIIRSSRYIRKYKTKFNQLETFCMFVGHPRSGTSLVGSMLDAHPDIIVSHEIDVLKYLKTNFSRERIVGMIISNSASKCDGKKRKGGGYDNTIDSGWQGKIRNLKVVGDKKAGMTALRLGNRPDLIEKIRLLIGVDVKFIYVQRNPFDTIATMSAKSGYDLEQTIKNYLDIACCVKVIKEKTSHENFFTIDFEELIFNSEEVISQLCEFLNQKAPEFYINACKKILFSSPKKTRKSGKWDQRTISLFYEGVRKNNLEFLYQYRW